MRKVILGLVGLIAGVFAGGGGDILVTLAFPHGGWGHVSPEMRHRFVIWVLLGGILGVVTGAMFDALYRKK
jgi:hypothetical protein